MLPTDPASAQGAPREEIQVIQEASLDCPHCGAACGRDEAHNGVAMIYGPWGCGGCGWSEVPKYDCRDGVRMDGVDRVLDQYGVSHHVDRPDGMAVIAGLNRGRP